MIRSLSVSPDPPRIDSITSDKKQCEALRLYVQQTANLACYRTSGRKGVLAAHVPLKFESAEFC